DGATVPANRELVLRGIAFDGGMGIVDVVVSADGGASWTRAALGKDLGRYSFREWTTRFTLPPGKHALKVRATNRAGQSQPLAPLWNPAGYMRNVVETTTVTAA
ncbi:MAG: oxidase, partial [Hyphomicrobiales bacterium]|nr:oxidase [Hyphomicrobiales bacterium]